MDSPMYYDVNEWDDFCTHGVLMDATRDCEQCVALYESALDNLTLGITTFRTEIGNVFRKKDK